MPSVHVKERLMHIKNDAAAGLEGKTYMWQLVCD